MLWMCGQEEVVILLAYEHLMQLGKDKGLSVIPSRIAVGLVKPHLRVVVAELGHYEVEQVRIDGGQYQIVEAIYEVTDDGVKEV